VVALIWGDRKNWREYYPTMLYIAVGNLLYNYLTNNYRLWVTNPDFTWMNHIRIEILYSLLLLPANAFLFLSKYPTKRTAKIVYYSIWIGIYVAVEWFYYRTGRIEYHNGWNMWWSVVFNLVMFPMLRLHHLKPMLALGISLVISLIYIYLFQVPVK